MTSLGSCAFVVSALVLACAGCSSAAPDDSAGAAADLSSGAGARSFVARGTGYFPAANAMEGGFVDRKGNKLNTLQQFLARQAAYVSVAMDTKAFSYGQRIRIQELNDEHGEDIVFRVVDTGGAFTGKGTTRMDICTANENASLDPAINGTLHYDAVDDDAPSEGN